MFSIVIDIVVVVVCYGVFGCVSRSVSMLLCKKRDTPNAYHLTISTADILWTAAPIRSAQDRQKSHKIVIVPKMFKLRPKSAIFRRF